MAGSALACSVRPATSCLQASSASRQADSHGDLISRGCFFHEYSGLRAVRLQRKELSALNFQTCRRLPRKNSLLAVASSAGGVQSGAEVFGAPQELSTPQKLVKPLPVLARHLACISLVGAAVGAGYAIGGKVAPPVGQVGGAVVLGAVGAVGAHVVNSAGKDVAAVELHNAFATHPDPSKIRSEDVEAIANKYGVSSKDGKFSDELKDLYARYVQAVIPPGEEPLRGTEAEAILSFKNALGLDDPEAAQAHIEVGKRCFRSRLETSDRDETMQEQRTFQKLVYVTALVFGDKHTFQVPWKRVLKVTDSQVELAIRNNAQALFVTKVEETAAEADISVLRRLKDAMVKLRLPTEVGTDVFMSRARQRGESHISAALEVLKSRARNKDTSLAIKELDRVLAYNDNLLALRQNPETAQLMPGVGPISVLGGAYDGDRHVDDLKLLYRTYLLDALSADRLVDEKVERLSALKSVFGLGTREAEALTVETTTRMYRRKLAQAAAAGGALDQASSKAAFLENLCEALRFDPERALQVHQDIYKQKLEQCLEDNKLSDDDMAVLLRLRVILCVPQAAVDAAHEDVCGRIFSKVVDEAVGAGVDGYDETMRKAVQESRENLRITIPSALNIASKAVRATFLAYVKRCKTMSNRSDGAMELKKLVLFSNLVVTDLIADIKGIGVTFGKPAKTEEDLIREAAAAKEKAEQAPSEEAKEEEPAAATASSKEDEEKETEILDLSGMPQSLQKTKSKETIDLGKSQKEITLKDDLELRDRQDLYKQFLLHCLSGEAMNAPMGVQIVTKRDNNDYIRLAQLGDLLGLNPTEVADIHKGLAEQAFRSNAQTLLADGQINPARMEHLKNMQKQLGLPADVAEKVVKSITATKMAGQIDTAVAQGKLTIEDVRRLKEMGVDIESMVNKNARMTMLRKLVDKQLSSGAPTLDREAMFEKLPEDLGLETNKTRPVIEEIAREKLKSSLVQAVANYRQKKISEVSLCINNMLASDQAAPSNEPLKWAVQEELYDLYSIYARSDSASDERRQRLLELLGIDESEAGKLREAGGPNLVMEAQEEEEFAF